MTLEIVLELTEMYSFFNWICQLIKQDQNGSENFHYFNIFSGNKQQLIW